MRHIDGEIVPVLPREMHANYDVYPSEPCIVMTSQ